MGIDWVREDNKVFVPVSKQEFEDAKRNLPKDEFKTLFQSTSDNEVYYRIDTPNDDELSYIMLNSIHRNLKTTKTILMFVAFAVVIGVCMHIFIGF